MKNEKLKNLQSQLPPAFRQIIGDILEENEAYVAHELVALSEAILKELAAIGFAIYLNQPNQREVYNDFLLNLFTSKGRPFNGGPLFHYAANMINVARSPESDEVKAFFWERGEQTHNNRITRLKELRNKVMHGFFVLPPETNRKEAEEIALILEEMVTSGLFKALENADYHFLKKVDTGVTFSGNWLLSNEDWEFLEKGYGFGDIAKAVRFQNSLEFNKRANDDVLSLQNLRETEAIENLFRHKQQGAFAIWEKPFISDDSLYKSLVKKLLSMDNYLPVFYEIEKDGITFSGDFLLRKIVEQLSHEAQKNVPNKNSYFKVIPELMNTINKQVIVILNHIETALFYEDHLLHLADFLYENQILLIGFGTHHPWMDRFFNDAILISPPNGVKGEDWRQYLDNYLRFKGPNKDIEEEHEHYFKLVEIGEEIINEINLNRRVISRRFAEQNHFPMEYVHELFNVLNPFYGLKTIPFQEDEIDDLYGFPKEVTEASGVYFALGSRDVKLDYGHKVLELAK